MTWVFSSHRLDRYCQALLVLGCLWSGSAFGQANNYYDHGTFPAPGSTATSALMRAELDLIEAGFAKLPQLSGNQGKALIINGAGNAIIPTNGIIRFGSTFPLAPQVNDLFIITTDGVLVDCSQGEGTGVTLCRYNGTEWVPLGGAGGGGGTSLPSQTISTSETAKLKICGLAALSDDCFHLYVRSDGRLMFRGVNNGVEGDVDIDVVVDAGNHWCLRDALENPVHCIEPSASGMGNIYTYGALYRPIRSIWVPASALYGDGTNCPTDPSTVVLNGAIKTASFICADHDGSRLQGSVKMPESWAGGTITITHVYMQTAANTSALHGDVACQSRANGEAISSTWGAEVAIDDSGVTGSHRNDFTTSGPVTCSGTLSGGSMLYFYYDLDAAGTVTPASTLHHLGFVIKYAQKSLSD